MLATLALFVLTGGADPAVLAARCDGEVAFFGPLNEWTRASSQSEEMTSEIERTFRELQKLQHQLTTGSLELVESSLERIGGVHRELRGKLKSQLSGLLMDVRNSLPEDCSVSEFAILIDGFPSRRRHGIRSGSGWSATELVTELPPGAHTLATQMLVECGAGERKLLAGDLTFVAKAGYVIKLQSVAAFPSVTIGVAYQRADQPTARADSDPAN